MKLTQLFKAYGDLIAHLFHVVRQLFYGIWKLSKLNRPLVSIFGSSKLPGDNKYSQFARDLASRLVDANVSVVTGGGPGIMEAANCGAQKKGDGVRSIGIGVKGLEGGKLNPCVEDYMIMHYYFPRKWLLTRYSMAFVIFPGGVGTLEELTELMTLIQTDKRERVPIVLVGKDFWSDILRWMNKALDQELLFQSDLDNLTITDDIEEAFEVVTRYCAECKV